MGFYDKWPHAIEDARAVLAFLRAKGATDYRVDPETIVLIGHSMGGACAFAVAIQEPSIQYVANLAGATFKDLTSVRNDPVAFERRATNIETMGRPLTGFSGRVFLNDLIATQYDQYDVETNAKTLAEKVILLVGGARDTLTKPDKNYWPMLQALQAANASQLTHHIFDDDHVFSSHRIALAQLVVSWLEVQCRGVSG